MQCESATSGTHSDISSGEDQHEAAAPLKPIPSAEEEERLLAIVSERFDRVPPCKDIDSIAQILRASFRAEMCLIGVVRKQVITLSALVILCWSGRTLYKPGLYQALIP
jgi:hypothetical protein